MASGAVGRVLVGGSTTEPGVEVCCFEVLSVSCARVCKATPQRQRVSAIRPGDRGLRQLQREDINQTLSVNGGAGNRFASLGAVQEALFEWLQKVC